MRMSPGIILFCVAVFTAQATERIYCASAAATHLFIRLGAANRLAAVEEFSRIIPGAEKIPVAGRHNTVYAETVAQLRIDHAVLWDYQREAAAYFRKRNIPVTLLKAVSIASYPDMVREVARLCNRGEAGEKLIEQFRRAVGEAVKKDRARVRVYFELYKPGRSVGSSSYVGELLTLAGATLPSEKNIQLGSEALVRFAPEVIFYCQDFTTSEALAARPGMSALPAVRQKRIYGINRLQLVAGCAPEEAIKQIERMIQCHSTK